MPLDGGIQNRTISVSLPIMAIEDKRENNRETASTIFSLSDRFTATRLHPSINFRGQISIGKFLFPIQDFSLREKDRIVFIENFSTNSFPKIEIILEEENSIFAVKDFKIRPSDNSVQGEILYTRFFLTAADAKKCSLNFRDIDFAPLNFSLAAMTLEEKKLMLYRAKLFRKLGFIERVFEKTKFNIPENISPDEAQQIEILFRGLTEGEFTNPSDSFVTIYKYKVSKQDLQDKFLFSKREFSLEFNERFFILGRFFETGKIIVKVEKAAIANPRKVVDVKENQVIDELRLNVFDSQIRYIFEKYNNAERLSRNKQKLERFRNLLHEEEPTFLASLLDESLAEITDKSAIETLEALLQYNDFPDRFSVLKPKLEKNRWRVPIALTYPKHEPIKLEDAFVDVRTGKVEMKISFDELLKKGKKKAKEAFGIA
ncbi:MAG: hypothetical protein M3033_10520 [Acidobacteriota bacterium]|nr:hypothetical protein [Acidobacteriota bacterium]